MTLGSTLAARSDAPAEGGPRDLAPRTARLLLGVVAVLAAVLAAVVHLWLFPDGSPNNDDAVYRMQAEALLRGELVLSAPEPARAYQPWFWTLGPDGYVAKYTPTVAALLAVSLRLVGSPVLTLMSLAAAVPLLAYALGRALPARSAWQGSRRAALTAAALLAASPLLLVQNGMELSYTTATVALLGFLAALVAGLQQHRSPRSRLALLAASGFALSALGTTRPYDAVLLCLLPLGWGLLALRPLAVRARLASVTAFALGGLPLGAVLLAYNAAVTGSPLTLPFGLFSPDDKIGFGERRMFPEDLSSEFGPLDGLLGLLIHARAVPLWTAGGALLVVLAAVAVRRWWRSGHQLSASAAVGGSAALITAGYAVFWGPWFAGVAWGGIRWYGPMYALPTLVPLVVLTAPLLVTALVERRRWVRPALAVSLALSVWQAGTALVTHVGQAAQTDTAVALLDALPADALVLTTAETPYLAHPLSPMRNPPGELARYAIAGGARDWEVVERAGAGRPLHLAQVPRGYYRRSGDPAMTLSRAQTVQGATLRLRLDTRQMAERPRARPVTRSLVVQRGDVTVRCPVDGLATSAVIELSGPTGLTGCTPSAPPDGWYDEGTGFRRCADTDCVTVALMVRDERRKGGLRERKEGLLASRQVPVRDLGGGRLEAMVDGELLVRSGVDDLVVTPAP